MLFVQDFHDHHIVGYENVSTNGAKAISMGAVFTPVSGAKTFQLKEWKPDGVEDVDNFQLLSSEDASTIGQYSYVSKAFADQTAIDNDMEPGELDHAIGWWQLGKVDWEDTEKESEFRRDAQSINVGDSFLVACGGSRNFAAQSAGQVPTDETSISRSAVKTPFFCNYLPVDVKLGNVSVDGVEDVDNFQLLSSADASTIGQYSYVSKAFADQTAIDNDMEPGELDHAIGWWQLGKVDWEDAEGESEFRRNNVMIGAGQGILLANGAARNVTITFPSSLEATK